MAVKGNRNTALDLMKIVGATLIILHHYQQGTKIILEHITFFNGKFNFGYVVEMFFVISGFLTYKGIEKHIEKNGKPPDFWTFGRGKARRIVPLLAISVVLEALLRYSYVRMAGECELNFALLDILVNATATGWGIFSTVTINQPTWYLSVLMLCYMEIYVSLWLSDRAKMKPDCLWLLLMALGVAANTYGWKAPFIGGSIGRGMFSFFAGTLISKHLRMEKKRSDMALALLPLILLFLLKYFHDFVSSGAFVFYTLFLWLPIVQLGLKYIPKPQYGGRIIEVLGMASFGVYIWNEPLSVVRDMASMAYGINLRTVGTMALFTACNWIVGVCSYFLLERPIDNLIRNGTSKEMPMHENT